MASNGLTVNSKAWIRWYWRGIVFLALVVISGVWLYRSTREEPLPPIPDGLEARMGGCVYPVRVTKPVIADPSREAVEFGSCVAVSGRGLFLTAAHILNDAGSDVRVTVLIDGRERVAAVMALDPSIDAALLHVADHDGVVIPLAARPLPAGAPAFIFGYPVEYSGTTLPTLIGTRGRVLDPRDELAEGRPAGEAIPVIRLRGSTHFGGSGGAVVDRDGSLIGLTLATRFVSSARRQSSEVFAIPADRLSALLQRHAPATELGPDPDGDLLVGIGDPAPLVADLPDPRISFTNIEFGLRVEVENQEVRDNLVVRRRDVTESQKESRAEIDEVTRSRITQRTAYRGGGGAQAGPFALPISYGGVHQRRTESEERRQSTTFTVSRERLAQVSQTWQGISRETKTVKITGDAGYFQATVQFANPSKTTCRLEAFDIIVRVNGRPRWTFPARSAAGFSPRTLAGTGGTGPDIAVLRFDRVNTREMIDLLTGQDRLDITFEVPPSSVRLVGGDGAETQARKLDSVRSKCATVEIEDGGRREIYISTAAGGGLYELPLSRLLSERLPSRAKSAWRTGPLGDYLAEFAGRRGVAILTADRTNEGRWLVLHNEIELSGTFRDIPIKPADRIQLRYLSGEQHWGDLAGLKRYVAGYEDLRQLWALEQNFWSELEGYNQSPDKPWDALAKQKTRDQARELRKRYMALFDDPKIAPALLHIYPDAEAKVGRFSEWFTGDDLHLPSYQLSVRGARVWWNLDDTLKPAFIVRSNGVEVRGDQRVMSPKGGSAEVKVGGGSSTAIPVVLVWSPFDAVEFRLWNEGIFGKDLLYLRVSDFFGPYRFIGRQPLDKATGAEPSLSGVELIWVIRDGDTMVRSDEFLAHLNAAKPRVLGSVPTRKLLPDILALDYWVQHNPASYYRAAILLEELYRGKKGSPEGLGLLSRAMLAYFRAFAFERCAEMATDLPDGDSLPPEEAKHLPVGIDVASLRQLAEVARNAQALDREGTTWQALARVMLHQQACLWLDFATRKRAAVDGVSEQQILDGSSFLSELVARDRKDLATIADPVIQKFLGTQIDWNEAELRRLSGSHKDQPSDSMEVGRRK